MHTTSLGSDHSFLLMHPFPPTQQPQARQLPMKQDQTTISQEGQGQIPVQPMVGEMQDLLMEEGGAFKYVYVVRSLQSSSHLQTVFVFAKFLSSPS